MTESSRGKKTKIEACLKQPQLSHRMSVEMIEIEQDELPTAVDLAG